MIAQFSSLEVQRLPIFLIYYPSWFFLVSFIGGVSLHTFHGKYQTIFPLLRMPLVTVFFTPKYTDLPGPDICNNMRTHNYILIVHDKSISVNVLFKISQKSRNNQATRRGTFWNTACGSTSKGIYMNPGTWWISRQDLEKIWWFPLDRIFCNNSHCG